jgi:CO/xanthine dehydrogenase Mo-binding subunit
MVPRTKQKVDAGLVVDPMFARTQFEGAALFGTDVSRSGEITAINKMIDQSNFYEYPVAPINEAPSEKKVHIVESGHCRRVWENPVAAYATLQSAAMNGAQSFPS